MTSTVEERGAHLRGVRPVSRSSFTFSSRTETIRVDDAPTASAGDAERAVVGAIPFESSEPDALLAPGRIAVGLPSGGGQHRGVRPLRARISADPSPDEYERQVARIVELIDGATRGGGDLQKVVLARRLRVDSDEPIDVDVLLARLRRDPEVTTFRLRHEATDSEWIGATPETLLDKRGDRVHSLPLAGSAPRSSEWAVDQAAARGLLASAKDRTEHRLVVEHVLDTLAPWCSALTGSRTPILTGTNTVWHLGTPIDGRLRDPDVPSLVLARALHPTPAVCGIPTGEAAQLIAEMEGRPRGLYAGAVGWSDGTGDGCWMVTLRCAEVRGSTAVLHAGAGLVRSSTPRSEREETTAKFRALLDALGVAELDR